MSYKKNMVISAAALSGVLLASCTTSSNQVMNMGECHGVNSCKGQGDCGGKGHDCAGKNTCKGMGWKKMTMSDCQAKGGEFIESKT